MKRKKIIKLIDERAMQIYAEYETLQEAYIKNGSDLSEDTKRELLELSKIKSSICIELSRLLNIIIK